MTAPRSRQRTDRGCHILELLTVQQPRTTEDIAHSCGISQTAAGTSLLHMEKTFLVRRVGGWRGRGAPTHKPPNLWALRCYTPTPP